MSLNRMYQKIDTEEFRKMCEEIKKDKNKLKELLKKLFKKEGTK